MSPPRPASTRDVTRTDRVTPEEIARPRGHRAQRRARPVRSRRPRAGVRRQRRRRPARAARRAERLVGDDPDLLPGARGAGRSLGTRAAARSGAIDFSHPVFEIFSSPRSGDLTAARIFRYRTLTATGPGPRALRRRRASPWRNAESAAARCSSWTSTLDSYWNDLPLKPVFVPFVHQVMRHLGRLRRAASVDTVGETVDPADAPPADPPAGWPARSRRSPPLSPSGASRRSPGVRPGPEPFRCPRQASTRSGRRGSAGDSRRRSPSTASRPNRTCRRLIRRR